MEIVEKLCLLANNDGARGGGEGEDFFFLANPYLREPKAKDSTVVHF